MYNIPLHTYITLHCIALHCIALHCIALHCIALHCIALHCIALHCIALHTYIYNIHIHIHIQGYVIYHIYIYIWHIKNPHVGEIPNRSLFRMSRGGVLLAIIEGVAALLMRRVEKVRLKHMAVCQNLVPLVNIKIAGKWMFIPLKMVLIGIDPYPYYPLVNSQLDPENDQFIVETCGN